MKELLEFLQEKMGREGLAVALGVHPSTINRYKNNEADPSTATVKVIFALALDYGMSEDLVLNLFMEMPNEN